jgi:glutaredoxin-like YruB-family protein
MPKITIYSTPTCPYCNLLKAYLKEHNIEFEDKNVAADKEAAQTMVEKSGQMGVPVSIITTDDGQEEIVVGFDKTRINELLNIQE